MHYYRALYCILIILLAIIRPSVADFRQHYRYRGDEAKDESSMEKEEESGSTLTGIKVTTSSPLTTATATDILVRVPFVFPARLHKYGPDRGHMQIALNSSSAEAKMVKLHTPIRLYARTYDTIHIYGNGVIGLSPRIKSLNRTTHFPYTEPLIAVFWTGAVWPNTGRIFFRQTQERLVLNYPENEFRTQYGLGEDFRAKSMLIVTWEEMAPIQAATNTSDERRNTFQCALLVSEENDTFAHFVYSKLEWNDNAVTGLNGVGQFHGLSGSGGAGAMAVAASSNIGVPGEWMFKVDGAVLVRCGPGFRGRQCGQRCPVTRWHYDCTASCYCEARERCDRKSGRCPDRCLQGYTNRPFCDTPVEGRL